MSKACSRCWSFVDVEDHHIVHREDGGSDDACNLLPLCRGCHDYRHAKEYILAHIENNRNKRQIKRIQIWEYRLKILEEFNIPEFVRQRGYTPYWSDVKTHYMSREVRSQPINQLELFQEQKE